MLTTTFLPDHRETVVSIAVLSKARCTRASGDGAGHRTSTVRNNTAPRFSLRAPALGLFNPDGSPCGGGVSAFAARLHVSNRTVQRWVADDRTVDLYEAERIAKAVSTATELEISVLDLAGGIGFKTDSAPGRFVNLLLFF